MIHKDKSQRTAVRKLFAEGDTGQHMSVSDAVETCEQQKTMAHFLWSTKYSVTPEMSLSFAHLVSTSLY